jgi:uncharacterized repeat protein (TIGR01451 family)
MKRVLWLLTILVILVSALAASQAQAKPSNQPTLNPASAEETTRVSVASDGTEGNGDTQWSSISADGRFVAFDSDANNLVTGDTNGVTDIFVHDRTTGQTIRASIASDGTQGDRSSKFPDISADGRYVVFESDARNLVSGDTNYYRDIFVHDLETGQTTLVSVASDGSQGDSTSLSSSISADGRYIAFSSNAYNLVSGDYCCQDVFVHDRTTGETTRPSTAWDGTQGNDISWAPSISSDGRYVAFTSHASNLVSGDMNNFCDTDGDHVFTDNCPDIIVHDRTTNQNSIVSVASDGTQGNSFSVSASISADGRYVVFYSFANNLVENDVNNFCDTNLDGVFTDNCWDIFLHDRLTGQTTLVSVASDGTQANNYSDFPEITADGRYITYHSAASNLVSGDTNGLEDIFVYDRMTGQTTLVSVTSDGTPANGLSEYPTISADGRFVVFNSYATNLVSGDTNGYTDIFVHERTTFAVSVDPLTDAANGAPGDTEDYTLTVTNTGNILDTFLVAVNGNAWSTNTPATVGPLTPSASQMVDVSVTIPPNAIGGGTDIATITLTSQGDNTIFATSTITTTASNVYGILVVSTVEGKSGMPGDTIDYTLSVTNTGNTSDTFNVVVNGNAWTTTAPATVGPLAPGISQTETISVTVPASVTGGGVDTATITFTSQGDNTQSDSTVLTTTAIAVDADLEVSISASPDPVIIGDNLTYTIVITNHGPADATNVVLTDNLPSGVAYVSDDSGCSYATGVATCNLGGIANDASKTVQIVVNVIAIGTLENTATATADQPDPGPGNNSDTTTTQAEFRKIYLPMIQR